MFAYYPVFWSMPTMVLSETAAAASFGLMNAIGHTGGFVGPYAVGYLNDKTGAMTGAFVFIAVCYLLAGGIVPFVKIQDPISVRNSLAREAGLGDARVKASVGQG
jgi:nitrate/nitrite transporter NarK